MDQEELKIDDLKESGYFVEHIRWEVTPKVFVSPTVNVDNPVDTTYGYMLYVDLVDGNPAIVVMQLKQIISKTIGYITEAPEDMMKDAINNAGDECIAGMCPLTNELQEWLKKGLGIS